MPIYSYEALKNNKEIVKGKVEANNHREARNIIRQMSLVPTKIVEETKDQQDDIKISRKKLPHMSLGDKIDFTSTFKTDAFTFAYFGKSQKKYNVLWE